jgi:succinyl-CoA synthetase beta subunit
VLRLGEDTAKQWLKTRGLPTPDGAAAGTPSEAAALAAAYVGGVMVKALVPTGRRGQAGAVIAADAPEEAAAAAAALLGQTVHGYPVRRVLVEERLDIASELYLAFSLSGPYPEMLLSREGGVEIEEVAQQRPNAVLRQAIHPIRGLASWDAIDLWSQAGVSGPVLRRLGALTVALFTAFQAGDALLLEINPLAMTMDGALSLAGVMMGVDEDALYRHRDWARLDEAQADERLSEREQRIARLNREIPDGECQYIELEGDIGLLVGGGGAGLYQHDLMVDMGGAPANHSVTPPTGRDTRKLKAVLEAIFDHPRLRGLLVGFNFAQMARADIRVQVLVETLREKSIDTQKLPIVIRLFGAGETEARALVEGWPGIHYLPRGTSLRDGVQRIVALTREAQEDA